MQLELIEKLADENLYELHVARLRTPTGPRLVSARRLKRQAGAVADMPEKLRRAFAAAAAVQHPHLLPPLGLYRADGSLWWLSARTEGFDLATVFARLASREVRITPPRTLQVGVDLVAGLAALHTAGHAHGGLGPRAALIDPEGVCRLDAVGLEAVLMRERELRRLARRGRAEQLAPEVVQGRGPEAAGDVFAVAALIYQLLTGQPPLGGQQRGVSTRHQAVRPPSKVNRSLPYACDAVFVKALAVAPRQRHADGTALGNAMDQLRRSLVDRPQETRAGVAEFITNLFPNEAKVAGMPGTLQRPARGGALEIEPAFAKASAGRPAQASGEEVAPAADSPPASGATAEAAYSPPAPGATAEAAYSPPAPGATAEAAYSPPAPEAGLPAEALAKAGDWGIPEKAEPIEDDGAGQVAAVAGLVDDSWPAGEEDTPAAAPAAPAELDTGEADDELEQAGDTAVMPMAAVHGGGPPPAAGAAEASVAEPAGPSRAKPAGEPEAGPAAAEAAGTRPDLPAASVPAKRPPWKQPAFMITAGLLALVVLSLLLMAGGLLSGEPEVGPTGPPAGPSSLIGFLSVEVDRPVQITLDGEQVPGRNSIERKVIRAGRHRVIIEDLAGRPLLDEVIEIRAGEHEKLRLVVPPGAGAAGPAADPKPAAEAVAGEAAEPTITVEPVAPAGSKPARVERRRRKRGKRRRRQRVKRRRKRR